MILIGKLILFDGPNGIPLWEKAEEHGIEKCPVWIYNIEHPELVKELNREYIEAGSDIILANTFSANGPAVELASPYTMESVVKAGMQITKHAAKGTTVDVGLAVGPVSTLLEPYGTLSEEECRSIYEAMIGTGIDNGADFIYVQTFMDLNMLKIAASVACSFHVPVITSMTFQKNGRTLFGNSPREMSECMEKIGVTAVGINCALGPDEMFPIVKEFAKVTDVPISVKANSGSTIKDGGTGKGCDTVSYADLMAEMFEYVTYIGGCCGTDPTYIYELGKRIKTRNRN